MTTIGPYERRSVVLHAWSPLFAEAAARLQALLEARCPESRVEHVGSTAVPGLVGKGILDLLVIPAPEALGRVKESLAGLGFEPQSGPEPFPEERPMRVGSISHAGRRFRIHVHVIPLGWPEAGRMIRFRAVRRSAGPVSDEFAAGVPAGKRVWRAGDVCPGQGAPSSSPNASCTSSSVSTALRRSSAARLSCGPSSSIDRQPGTCRTPPLPPRSTPPPWARAGPRLAEEDSALACATGRSSAGAWRWV